MTIIIPDVVTVADVQDLLLNDTTMPAPRPVLYSSDDLRRVLHTIETIAENAHPQGAAAMLDQRDASAVSAWLHILHDMVFQCAKRLEGNRSELQSKDYSDNEFKHQVQTLRDQRDLYNQDLVTINSMLIEEAENRGWCEDFETFVEAVNEATKLFEMKGRAWSGTAQWMINVRVTVPITADTEDMVHSYAETAGPKIARLIEAQLNAGDITDDLRRQMELDERSINVDIDLVDAERIYWDERPSR